MTKIHIAYIYALSPYEVDIIQHRKSTKTCTKVISKV